MDYMLPTASPTIKRYFAIELLPKVEGFEGLKVSGPRPQKSRLAPNRSAQRFPYLLFSVHLNLDRQFLSVNKPCVSQMRVKDNGDDWQSP